MKKIALIIGVILSNSFLCFSQNSTSCRIGLLAGINAANGKTDIGYHDILWRYSLGITVEKRFSPAIALVSHLLYSRQGYSNKAGIASNGNVLSQQTYTLDYITLPVLLRVRFKRLPFFWEAGGQVGGLVYNHLYFAESPPINQSIPNTNFLDAGLTGGLGYRLGRHWVADLRYYHGLRSARKQFFTITDPQTGVVTNYPYIKWYNRVYSLNLSYYF